MGLVGKGPHGAGGKYGGGTGPRYGAPGVLEDPNGGRPYGGFPGRNMSVFRRKSTFRMLLKTRYSTKQAKFPIYFALRLALLLARQLV